jgi:hypothetical protein
MRQQRLAFDWRALAHVPVVVVALGHADGFLISNGRRISSFSSDACGIPSKCLLLTRWLNPTRSCEQAGSDSGAG